MIKCYAFISFMYISKKIKGYHSCNRPYPATLGRLNLFLICIEDEDVFNRPGVDEAVL